MNVDLTPEEARWLSILAASDLRHDRERGIVRLADRHQPAWDKLQPACQWDGDE